MSNSHFHRVPRSANKNENNASSTKLITHLKADSSTKNKQMKNRRRSSKTMKSHDSSSISSKSASARSSNMCTFLMQDFFQEVLHPEIVSSIVQDNCKTHCPPPPNSENSCCFDLRSQLRRSKQNSERRWETSPSLPPQQRKRSGSPGSVPRMTRVSSLDSGMCNLRDNASKPTRQPSLRDLVPVLPKKTSSDKEVDDGNVADDSTAVTAMSSSSSISLAGASSLTSMASAVKGLRRSESLSAFCHQGLADLVSTDDSSEMQTEDHEDDYGFFGFRSEDDQELSF